MKRILICTHGELAHGLIHSATMIAGDLNQVFELCVALEDSIEDIKLRIGKFLDAGTLDDHHIILTDIPGGSTTQSAFPFADTSKRIHVVSGVNLGLLLEIILSPEEDMTLLLSSAVDSGKETMKYLNISFGL